MQDKNWETLFGKLDEMEEKARISGGLAKQEQERQKGKMTARERVLAVLDSGTFVEINVSKNKSYDACTVIEQIVDDGDYLEVQPAFARNMIICFARFAGRPVWVVVNRACFMADVIDIDAVIRPEDTRSATINALLTIENKEKAPRAWRKHGNIPL